VLGLWSISTTTLELILCEIPEKRKIVARFAPSPATDDSSLPHRKIFSTFFILCADFFLLKGKENFSASASAPKARGGGASLRLAGKNFLPLNPSIFARSLPKFCGGWAIH